MMDMEVVKCQITVLKEWETSLEKKSLKQLGISAKQLKQFLQRLITNVDSLMLKARGGCSCKKTASRANRTISSA